MSCNQVENINTDYCFGGTSTSLQWVGNVMDNSAYGYVLDGLIGAQPGTGQTADNNWNGTWTSPYWQTYVTAGSSAATSSRMTVQNTSSQNPTLNGSDFGGAYSLASITTSSAPPAPCDIPPGTDIVARTTSPGSTAAARSRTIYKMAAKKHLEYAANKAEKDWIGQLLTYRAISADSTLADSSDELTAFYNMANAHSRYKYLMDVEKALAHRDYATASAALSYPTDSLISNDSDAATGAVMADDTEADAVVRHYKRYYKLYIKYRTDTLSPADTAELTTLANMCPFVDGSIIYQARGLYNRIHPMQIRQFSDVGCEPTAAAPSSGSRTAGMDTASEAYILYPNPSDGNITVQQSVPDNNPVLAEVLNATGMSVYKGTFLFTGGKTSFNMYNKVAGLYLLQLTDSKGNKFMLKFVIE